MRTSLTAALATLAMTLPPLVARAEEPNAVANASNERAETHVQRGVEFYAEKQYELALVEFRAAYALDPRPDYLFALAQAERLSGDCPSAVVYYREFLATDPAQEQAKVARINAARCERALESGPTGQPAETDVALRKADEVAEPEAAPEPMVLAASPAPPPSPWYTDPLGDALLATGAVAVLAGGGFLLAAENAEGKASDATTYDAYSASLNTARSRRTIGALSLAGGALLTGAAIYRFVRREPERRTTLVAAPTSGGAVMGISGAF